ncbi:glycosyltransferase family 2 protein [Altericroceibacterium spongiae]|uniref:Glycosyltransferase family 2 protein n=1 Tax=Altericroceibacterium spongiae TaxID=2320269 RepID=A0A420EJG6_9SPHN|nr:glycosyltransferase family A protein [Altericroceibacterium spongiae]RKF20800.1 glycosyltransferase family 2 protein [Altericroceibacterium spongiae]
MIDEPLPPKDRPYSDSASARVAVIVPAYGVADVVGEALSSLEAQTMEDWECVVIDDGSPDDVTSAVEPFLSDSRIRFLKTANRGVSSARNTAIASCKAPLIALLDGDDRFEPDYLARIVPLMEADKDARLATCNARLFGSISQEVPIVQDKQGNEDGRTGSLADVLDRSFNVYIGSTFRRADYERIGGFDEAMAQAEDLDLWFRLMALGGHALYVDAILGAYRVREGSASGHMGKMLRGNIRAYEKVLQLIGGQPETALVHQLLEKNRRALRFEDAIDMILDGKVHDGLEKIAGNDVDHPTSLAWKLSMRIWRIFPSLAPAMLAWRRHTHRRGGQSFRSFTFSANKKAA